MTASGDSFSYIVYLLIYISYQLNPFHATDFFPYPLKTTQRGLVHNKLRELEGA